MVVNLKVPDFRSIVPRLAAALLAAACLTAALPARAQDLAAAALQSRSFSSRRTGARGLLNPLLEIEPDLEYTELRPFRHKIEQLIALHKSTEDIVVASVYFRDLNNGAVIGVDSDEKFVPASLLKVPIMLAVFHKAEDNPDFLNMQVRYDARADAVPMLSTRTLEAGQYYTVERLTRAMLAESDNNAAFLLKALVGPKAVEDVYVDLGLSIPGVRDPDDEIRVKEYGTFFRMLYNASYLSRANSQKALEMLAGSTFADGLRAGVPADVVVAHKYGERYRQDAKVRQLHDCGIVYYPPRPYLLCIMTRGEDFNDLKATIKDLSRLVYEEVSSADKPAAKP